MSLRSRLIVLAVAALPAATLPPAPARADAVYTPWRKKEHDGRTWWECLYRYRAGCGVGAKYVVYYPAGDPHAGWFYFHELDGSPLVRYALPGNPLYDADHPVAQRFDARAGRWVGDLPVKQDPGGIPVTPPPTPPPPAPRPPGPGTVDPAPLTRGPAPPPPEKVPPTTTHLAGEHRLRVFNIPAGTKKLQIWYWVPMETPLQKVLTLRMKESPAVGRMVVAHHRN